MNAVHGSIIENLKQIEIIYEETIDAFKKDRTNTGDSKEVTVSQFIASYLSNDYQVKSTSKIYSRTQETNNIDCVVLSPNHPRLITPKREVILAEGVFAAIEVKPDISTLTEKSEFQRGLNQIKSVKNIIRDVDRLELTGFPGEETTPKYYDKIPSVIFSSKSTELRKTVDYICENVRERKLDHEEIPDLIVCLDKGLIFYSPVFSSTDIGQNLKSKLPSIPKKAFVTYASSEKPMILIMFLRYFLNFPSPHMLLTDFVVKKYLTDIETNFVVKLLDADKMFIKK
ncbi:DUF6602 domain-containing protein [Flavobacterium sp. ABG]|uniref:DUF6602 domain-containing protein n=1 Tax=Flavobacterium sp. ABG TaxID=1423322 RepID=UPI00064981F0|nr:DUF6602 domain-containing protein [Flavobacterium sp. ABG]KLT70443.1 hypothetical protein AB674_07170 [Flavobacterium sp. ABG]